MIRCCDCSRRYYLHGYSRNNRASNRRTVDHQLGHSYTTVYSEQCCIGILESRARVRGWPHVLRCLIELNNHHQVVVVDTWPTYIICICMHVHVPCHDMSMYTVHVCYRSCIHSQYSTTCMSDYLMLCVCMW